ncbi:hypothetical protein Ancab_028314 [Ancistrocladus abbreviatus]
MASPPVHRPLPALLVNPNLKIPIISSSLPWDFSSNSNVSHPQGLAPILEPNTWSPLGQFSVQSLVRCCSGLGAAEWVDISIVGGREILGRVARAHGSFAAELAVGSTCSFAAIVATDEPVEPHIRNDRLHLGAQENVAWLEASMHKFLFMDVG